MVLVSIEQMWSTFALALALSLQLSVCSLSDQTYEVAASFRYPVQGQGPQQRQVELRALCKEQE